VLIIRRSKLHYTASGIITPIGDRLLKRLSEDCRFGQDGRDARNSNIKRNTKSRRYLIVQPKFNIILSRFSVTIQTVLGGTDFESMDSTELI